MNNRNYHLDNTTEIKFTFSDESKHKNPSNKNKEKI